MLRPAFIVSKTILSENGTILFVTYKEPDGIKPHSTEIPAQRFEHYLQCLHDVDCPSLREWLTLNTAYEINKRVADFMECMMWGQHTVRAYSSYEDYRNHIGTL